jgi:pimeloyl-ACP methyl ester carboxylesterase
MLIRTSLALILPSFVACLLAANEPKVIEANPAAGFFFPYVLHVPAEVERGRSVPLVVETNNTGVSDDYGTTLADTLGDASGSGLGPMLSRHSGYPLLMPVFPRPGKDWRVYTHALDRDSMLLGEGPMKRLDLQLLVMVEDARRRLREAGYTISSKFIMVGFSASGSFANRFAFLHPDRLLAVVSGGVNAFPMLPVAEVDGDLFRFPLGVADMEALTGEAFNLGEWRTLPQMVFMGALDNNDAVKYEDAYSDEERRLIFEHVGTAMHERWMKAQQLCLEKEPRINFITYGQVGHWTNRQVGMDIVNFLQEAIRPGKEKD